jgi:alkanesulfonate monooxygenase SsuD/methylene tetrahydromethanopterin reductase-like flavin-dependent oxidoreductase (luciferase family)
VEVGIYVPQVALSFEELRHRAERCEQLGIRSLWLYDHLYGPGLPQLPSLEAWTLATALLTCTRTLRVGHLVLCNQFRHPALLAKMAATLDVVSGGRLDLGIGSGSYEPEHAQAGLPWGTAAERSERLAETLEILTRAFAGDVVDFDGAHYKVHGLPTVPRPVQRPGPPIVVGGAGERRTLPLVARYADVWNVPTYALGELDRKVGVLRDHCERIGRDPASIRLSLEAVLALAPDEASLPAVRAVAERRFGDPGFGLDDGGLVGTAPAVVERLRGLGELGFDHVVLITHDRASDETLDLLASDVVPHLPIPDD